MAATINANPNNTKTFSVAMDQLMIENKAQLYELFTSEQNVSSEIQKINDLWAHLDPNQWKSDELTYRFEFIENELKSYEVKLWQLIEYKTQIAYYANCMRDKNEEFLIEMYESRFSDEEPMQIETPTMVKSEPELEISDTENQLNEAQDKRRIGRGYSCNHPNCDRRFKLKIQLNGHINRVHRAPKPFVCKALGCKRTFKLKQNFVKHKVVHAPKPLMCIERKRRLNIKNNAQTIQHFSSFHKDERPFICDKCGAKFSRSLHLKKHKEVHEKVVPLSSLEPNCDELNLNYHVEQKG